MDWLLYHCCLLFSFIGTNGSNRSGAYAGMKKYQEALSDASKCIELNGSFVKGYSRKGLGMFGFLICLFYV